MAHNKQQWQGKTAFEQDETLTRTRPIKGGPSSDGQSGRGGKGAERGDYIDIVCLELSE